MKEKILAEFMSQRGKLEEFEQKMSYLLAALLSQKGIRTHQLTSRTKTIESLAEKIDRKGGYQSIQEVTDLVGVRIITYLKSDVSQISQLIRKEFDVDEVNSIDKRLLNNDQFGYKSLHLIVSLKGDHSILSEYKLHEKTRFEVQVRSILQHAWAEIEHDLGYKAKYDIPSEYRRNFNRLAALLEVADLEFDSLKAKLSAYELEVGDLIRDRPEDVQLNQASLHRFNLENSVLIEARNFLAIKKGWSYVQSPDAFEGIPERFNFFGFDNIKQLDDSLISNKKVFFDFIEEFTKKFDYDRLPISIVVFYYQHFLAAKTEDIGKVEEYLNFSERKINPAGGTAQKFVKIYQEVRKRGQEECLDG